MSGDEDNAPLTEITATVDLDTQPTVRKLREIGDAFHHAADKLEDTQGDE